MSCLRGRSLDGWPFEALPQDIFPRELPTYYVTLNLHLFLH